VQKENSHHELPRAANGSRPPFRLQGCFLTRRKAQDFHKKATPTVSRRKEVQHREALRHGHCHAEGFARRPAGFDGSAAVEACWSPCKTLRVAVAMPERFSVLDFFPAADGWCCFLVEILCFPSRQKAALQPERWPAAVCGSRQLVVRVLLLHSLRLRYPRVGPFSLFSPFAPFRPHFFLQPSFPF